MNNSFVRINSIIQKLDFKKYLEIGVWKGETFSNVNIETKVAVDPKFQFDFHKLENDSTFFYEMPSNNYFDYLKDNPIIFDIIYIDGLHTFEQSYKDFLNAINYIHEKSIIILDDTLPSDPWSALSDKSRSYKYRELANIKGKSWHGDVYKTIFAIHDFHLNFNYVTLVAEGNPQTITWKSESRRSPIFNNIESIKNLTYFDLLDNIHILCPEKDKNFLNKIYTEIDPMNYKNIEMKYIVRKLV